MTKEQWDTNFSDNAYVYGETANAFIQSKSHVLPAPSKVGCFAEGEGRNAVHLARQGHDVTAYDQSSVGLQKTEELAEQNNVSVSTVEMDLTRENVAPDQFDAAVMVFGHVPKSDQKYFINNIVNSVKPGGYVIFEIYSTDQLPYKSGGPPVKGSLYEPSDILDWILPYKCLHFYYGEAERIEGKRHTGLGHVIQVMIQK